MGFFDNAFFPPTVNGELDIVEFLKACEHLPSFFDLMSAALKPVKSDLEGNIRKIRTSHERGPDRFRTVRSLLEDEIRLDMHKKDNSACVGLLWLKRGLDYVMMMLHLVVESFRKGVDTDNCHVEIRGAYDYALKRYHNWLSQKIFQVATHAFPKRRQFIRCLAGGSDSSDAEVIQVTEAYVKSLRPIIDYLNRLYVELQLESAEAQYPADYVPPSTGTSDQALPNENDSELDESKLTKMIAEAANAAKSTDANCN